jgi:hypothetical protein
LFAAYTPPAGSTKLDAYRPKESGEASHELLRDRRTLPRVVLGKELAAVVARHGDLPESFDGVLPNPDACECNGRPIELDDDFDPVMWMGTAAHEARPAAGPLHSDPSGAVPSP